MKRTQHDSFVFTDEELIEINEFRRSYEELTDREKFLVKEALKVYMYTSKK